MTVFVGHKRFHQITVFIQAIAGACKRSISLGAAAFRICLIDGNLELLQRVGEHDIGFLVPVDLHRLRRRDHISLRYIYLFQCVSVRSGDRDVRKRCHASVIRGGEHINIPARSAFTVEAKGDACVQAVLRVFHDNKVALLELVVEADLRGFSCHDGNALRLLRLVVVSDLLGHRIGAGDKALDFQGTVIAGLDRLVDTVAADGHIDPGDYAIFAGFHDPDIAAGSLDLEARNDVFGLCYADDHVLKVGISVGHELGGGTDATGFRQRNGDLAIDIVRSGHNQFVAVLGNLNTTVRGSDTAISEDAVAVGQSQGVLAIGVTHCFCAAIGKTRHCVVGGHIRNDVVVHLSHFGMVVSLADGVQDDVRVALKSDRVTSAADKLPDQKLGGYCLRTVRAADAGAVPGSAKGKNCLNGILHVRIQTIPAFRGTEVKFITQHKMMAWLNAVRFFIINPNSNSMFCAGA